MPYDVEEERIYSEG